MALLTLLAALLGLRALAEVTLESGQLPPPSGWSGGARAAIGRYVQAEDPRASLLFEGVVKRGLGRRWEARADVVIERPLNAYEDWRLPRGTVALARQWSPLFLTGASLSLLNVDQWRSDGFLGRLFLYGEGRWSPFSWLTLQLRAGPLLYVQEERQRADGTEIPSAGLGERLSALGNWGPLLVEIFAAFDQKRIRRGWRNDYGFGERVGVRLAKNLLLGVAHELWTGLVDSSSGLVKPLRLVDERDSRVSSFIEWVF